MTNNDNTENLKQTNWFTGLGEDDLELSKEEREKDFDIEISKLKMRRLAWPEMAAMSDKVRNRFFVFLYQPNFTYYSSFSKKNLADQTYLGEGFFHRENFKMSHRISKDYNIDLVDIIPQKDAFFDDCEGVAGDIYLVDRHVYSFLNVLFNRDRACVPFEANFGTRDGETFKCKTWITDKTRSAHLERESIKARSRSMKDGITHLRLYK